MSRYIYYEGCGYESEPFDAADDDAAEKHVLQTFRSPENADFDGDEGGIVILKLDEDDEEYREGVVSFEGENMIADPYNQRQSYDGLGR